MLKTSKRTKDYIMNLCNYDILQNHKYADSFLFTSIDHQGFEDNSCDVVAQMLNVGEDHISSEEFKDIVANFGKEMFTKINDQQRLKLRKMSMNN